MKFTLEINCDNAAFGNTPIEVREETARILTLAAARLQQHENPVAVCGQACVLRDSNGNRVGTAKFTEGGEG